MKIYAKLIPQKSLQTRRHGIHAACFGRLQPYLEVTMCRRYSLEPFEVRDVAALQAPHTLVPQFAHVHLQGKQREDHEAEDGKRHNFS